MRGNLGRGIIKVSAVKPEHRVITAPAIVFDDQSELIAAFKRGELERDFVAVIRFQGPAANGMPELHKLMPTLGVLQDRGFKVALVTDGRMSGASGKVPSAIHMTPEAAHGGPIAKVRNGDRISLNAHTGEVNAEVPPEEWAARTAQTIDLTRNQYGVGRELFAAFRRHVDGAEQGATSFKHPDWTGNLHTSMAQALLSARELLRISPVLPAIVIHDAALAVDLAAALVAGASVCWKSRCAPPRRYRRSAKSATMCRMRW